MLQVKICCQAGKNVYILINSYDKNYILITLIKVSVLLNHRKNSVESMINLKN